MKKSKIGIIGGGISGLATAARLRKVGHEVVLFESESQLGGKMNQFIQDGFRFDTGPSLFTLPELLEQLFIDCGENPSDYFSYFRLDPITKYFFEDGLRLNAFASVDHFAKEIASKTNTSSEEITKYLGDAKFTFDVTRPLFLERSLHRIGTFFNKDALKGYANLHKLSAFDSLHAWNKKQFSDERIVQLFDRYATYNGSNPYKAPATLKVISHLEHAMGAYYPKGGIYAIAKALTKLCEKLGVFIQTNSRVSKLLFDRNQTSVRGLEVNGEEIILDAVVSGVDIAGFYDTLAPDIKKPKSITSSDPSSSAMIFFWGMNEKTEQLDVHNVFFSDNYKEEFDCIEKGELTIDPTVYVYVSSKVEVSDAPTGCENWFVMINTPIHRPEMSWDRAVEMARVNIQAKLEHALGQNIRQRIRFEKVMTPKDIEANTSSKGGALYGNSSNSRYSAFQRHSNFHSSYKNLYFCGGSVHPGGGIPLCLLSSAIVAKEFAR
jgi:phytoene desaturase